MFLLRAEMEKKRKSAILKIEVKKNQAIKELTQKHGQKYDSIKNYYQEITNTNLDMIRQLKEDLTVAKNDENTEKKLLRQEIEKNAHVKDPYEKALIAIE